MASYRDIVQQELRHAKQRYRDAGLDPPVIERTINGRKHEMLTYPAPGAIVAGHVDAFTLNFAAMTPDTMPVVTWATTTEQVIRSNERMEIAGVQLKNYFANPVILWSHMSNLPPIGKGMNPRPSVVKGEKAMLLDIRFNCIGQFAQEICMLVMLGDVAAGSHGFIPLASKIEPTQNYPDAYPQFPNVCTYTKWEMLEFSPCTIPMNPGALRQHDHNAIDTEFEARLRDRIQSGLIAHEGDGIVHALGGNSISWQQREASRQIQAAPAAEHPIDPTTNLQPEPEMPNDIPNAGRHEYYSVWDFGAVYAMVPEPPVGDITRFAGTIAPDDLTADGIERMFVIPLLCDVKTQNVSVIKAALAGAEEFEVTCGEIAVDTGDEWWDEDRMFLDIVSPGGVNVSDQLSEQVRGWKDDVRIRVASLKTGRGAAYAGSDQLSGKTFTVTEVVFRDVTGTETTIPLAASVKTHIDRVRNITMPTTKQHDMGGTPDPNAPMAAPALPTDPDAAADGQEANDLKTKKGLDFDLAALAELEEDSDEWIAMAALAETNSNNQDVKSLMAAAAAAAQTTKDAVVKILTALGVDMSGRTPPDGAEPPADGSVQSAWYKAMSHINYRKHVGAAFNATHKGYIKAAYEASAALHTAAFGTESPKTGTASMEVAELTAAFHAFQKQYEADANLFTGKLAVVEAAVSQGAPAQEPEPEPKVTPELPIVDLSEFLKSPIPA